MKQVFVKSLQGCKDYYIANKYNKNASKFIIISIQDSDKELISFSKTDICIYVLTLIFYDIVKLEKDLILMNKQQARQIVKFLRMYDYIDVVVVHCMFDQSRSLGVGRAIKASGILIQ
ncbi:hypothetical protein [Clostridium butyricum]|uniref:hypothetical protein n=1 Tax=Clostridium butyricum TaxID=1492 RepID=UPI002AAF94FE|nr:hypothetical protein [Clostridium butyricum]